MWEVHEFDSGKSRAELRRIRHKRIRKHITGTAERPRLCVFRSSRHIYAQIIDDENGTHWFVLQPWRKNCAIRLRLKED